MPGAEHPGHRRGGPVARHSLPPAQHRQPGAVRPRAEAAAHSGRRDRPHQRHCRGHRPGQGDDPVAAPRRRACPRPAAGPSRTPRTPGRRPPRSACRWWSSRWMETRAAAWPRISRRPSKLPRPTRRRGTKANPILVEKFVPGHDYRLLVVGDQVVAAARREPAQVLGDGAAHGGPTGRSGQRRSAPRRASRHGPEQDQARRHRPGGAGRSGTDARGGSAGGHHRADPPQRQPEHRRHGHRRDRAGASGGGGCGGRRRQDRGPGHRRRRRGGPRHLASA